MFAKMAIFQRKKIYALLKPNQIFKEFVIVR